MSVKNGKSGWMRPSVIALVLANLIPLFGVLVLNWEVFPLLLLFWIENILIGIFNVAKMMTASPGSSVFWGIKLFIVPFFCFHYGMFTFVHGIFVITMFGGDVGRLNGIPNLDRILFIVGEQNLWWGVLGLALSHAISFATNYIGRGEYKQTTPMQLMMQPYGRVMVLHVTILIGGFLMMMLKSPTVGLLLLVLLKIALDVRAHLREHRKFETAEVKRENYFGLLR